MKNNGNPGTRGLAPEFIDDLKRGVLQPFLEAVRSDNTLFLAIRNEYINIYYRGGNISKISRAPKGGYGASFDSGYALQPPVRELIKKLPMQINNVVDAQAWASAFGEIKNAMDRYFTTEKNGFEREYQQLLARECNSDQTATATDYFICDIEYSGEGKFDAIAVLWRSTPSARKIAEGLRFAILEVKFGDQALDGKSGMAAHVRKCNKFLASPAKLKDLKKDIKTVFNQLHELGLIKNKHKIESLGDARPEFIFVLINHDPATSALARILDQLPEMPDADMRFATANFFGMGLFGENIFPLEEFKTRFGAQIG